MRKPQKAIQLTSYNELLGIDESVNPGTNQIVEVPLSELYPFKNHPFQVRDDEKMEETVESIRNYGVLNPGLVRPRAEGGYEVVAGHRRKRGCELAGKTTMPVLVRDYTDDEAVVIMVDSNIQRENILPSEKAFAYKLRLDCLKRQGQRTDLTSVQIEQKLTSREAVAAEMGESASSIQRYIRLTNLIPPLLDMVDAGKPGFAAAVELSYLSEERQQLLLKVMAETEKKPNTSQAKALRKASDSGYWSEDQVKRILFPESSPMPKMIQLPTEQLQRFFPADTSPAEMADVLMAALTEYRLRHSESGANSAMSGLSDA